MAFDVQKIADFIGHTKGIGSYLHNTDEEWVAVKSMEDGFRFADCLYKTTDRIETSDPVILNVWNQRRGMYGPYTMVVQIGSELFKKYGNARMPAEYMLAKDRFFDKEEGEYIYTLQPQFVKGYFNRNTNEGQLNPLFNPSYDNPELAKLNAVRFLDF